MTCEVVWIYAEGCACLTLAVTMWQSSTGLMTKAKQKPLQCVHAGSSNT